MHSLLGLRHFSQKFLKRFRVEREQRHRCGGNDCCGTWPTVDQRHLTDHGTWPERDEVFLAYKDLGLARFDDVTLLADSTLIDQKHPRLDLDIVGQLGHSIEFRVAEPLKEGQSSQSRGAIDCLFSLSEHNSHLSAWTGAPVRDDGRRNPLHLTGGIHGLGNL